MSRDKLIILVLITHKLEPRITHLLKYGKIKLITSSQTYGVWDVCSMRWLLCRHLSKLQVWKTSIIRFYVVIIRNYQNAIVKIKKPC